LCFKNGTPFLLTITKSNVFNDIWWEYRPYLTLFATKSYATFEVNVHCASLLQVLNYEVRPKYFSISTMQQLKHRDHAGFVMAIKLLLSNFAILHQITCMTGLC